LRRKTPVVATAPVGRRHRSFNTTTIYKQADGIRPIIEKQVEKRSAIIEKYRDKGRSARREIRSEMEALQQETETQLVEISSEYQMEAYRKLQEQRREKMGRSSADRFNAVLNLK
jgi:hypothetical protein